MPLQASAVKATPLFGGAGPAHVKAVLLQEEETIQGGRPFWVALKLN